MELLKAEKVSKIYRTSAIPVKALDEVSLSIEEGSFLAIMGRSGSGKSTLLNVLSGLESVDFGIVYLKGTDITKLNDKELSAFRRKQIGFVFQSYYLLPEFTVMENILIPIFLDHAAPDMEHVKMLLECLGISQKKRDFPNELSGGQRQRVAIARAMCAKPSILFADEPTGNLDLKSGEEVMALFSMIQKEMGQTIVMVTHDLGIAKQADIIIKLEDGKIVQRMEGEH